MSSKRRDHLSNAFSLCGGQFLCSRQHIIVNRKSRPHDAYLLGNISHQSSYIRDWGTSSWDAIICTYDAGVGERVAVDGILYVTGPNAAAALDARTGRARSGLTLHGTFDLPIGSA
jgi:hypothetical protein